MEQTLKERVAARLEALGINKFEAARRGGLERTFLVDILNGKKVSVRGANLLKLARGLDCSTAYLTGEASDPGAGPDNPRNIVRVMGYVGAGAKVEPEFEQVPPDGLDTIELPFPIPDGIISFVVRGDSMLPRYDDGDALLVFSEQQRQLESFYGEEAAVRTTDGYRYLKTILKGPGNTVTLASFNNPRPIEGVRLTWIGEIYLTVRSGQLRRIEARERATASRRARARARETKGMDELPLKGGEAA